MLLSVLSCSLHYIMLFFYLIQTFFQTTKEFHLSKILVRNNNILRRHIGQAIRARRPMRNLPRHVITIFVLRKRNNWYEKVKYYKTLNKKRTFPWIDVLQFVSYIIRKYYCPTFLRFIYSYFERKTRLLHRTLSSFQVLAFPFPCKSFRLLFTTLMTRW